MGMKNPERKCQVFLIVVHVISVVQTSHNAQRQRRREKKLQKRLEPTLPGYRNAIYTARRAS